MSDDTQSGNVFEGTGISEKQMYGQLSKAMNQTIRDIGKADAYNGKPEKFFGMDVDPTTAILLKGVFNNTAEFARHYLAPGAFNIAKNVAEQHFNQGDEEAALYGATAAFVVSAGMKSSIYLENIYKSLKGQHDDRVELAHKIAPVLDMVKGNHSLAALMSVSQSENGMIYAHRRRLAKIAHNDNINNMINLVGNAGANLALDFNIPIAMMEGKRGADLESVVKSIRTKKTNGKDHSSESESPLQALKMALNSAMAPLTETLINSNKRKLKESLSGYSALEMVLELEDQVTNNPNVKQIYPPRSKTGCSLEEYLMKVMIQYQKDLADIDPDQSEIRDALREDLQLVAKPMAEAIRSGKISAMALVRVIGEGHVIKAHGRVIASATEVEAEIERLTTGRTEKKVHQSPEDYYATRGYDKKELREAIEILKKHSGSHDEYLLMAAWHSDAVLENAGFSASEVKSIREEVGNHYAQWTMEAFAGAVAKGEEELRLEGLPSAEVRKLIEFKKLLERKGPEAFNDLLESPTNPHGVEGILADLAVPNTKIHGAVYMSNLRDKGRQALAANDNADDSKKPESEQDKARPKTFVERTAAAPKHDREHHERTAK